MGDDDTWFRPADALGPPPWPVPRAENVSALAFARFAARGLPLVVTDGASGLPLRGWSCADFATRFRGGHMRREYDQANNPSDANTQRFDDLAWTEQRVPNGVPPVGAPGGDPEAPRFAPMYWGVKENAFETWRGEAALLHDVQRLTAAPYFLSGGEANLRGMRQTPEFWLGANGTGAKAHMDGHCQSTVAVQLSGTRRWRLGRIPRSVRRSREQQFNDGDVYSGHYTNGDHAHWQPTYVATLRAGEALVFPPGMIHETLNVGNACAASVTYQFPLPAPAAYWRAMLPLVLRLGDLSNCWGRIWTLATLGRRVGQRGDAARLAAHLDVDRDGGLSAAELLALFAARDSGGGDDDAEALARDALLYHDSDGDGLVQLAELIANIDAFRHAAAAVAAEPAIDDEDEETREEDEAGENAQDEL